MEKLVASMALIQGISAVENSIDAFRALAKEIKLAGGAVGMLKKALNTLKAHPIIAIASAITAIGIGINQIYKAERKEQAEKNYNAVNPLLENSVNKIENIENDYEIKVLQARGATEEEIYNKKVELLKKYEKEYRGALEANANQYHTYTDELKEQADVQAIESQKIVEKKRQQITEEGKLLKIKKEQAELDKQAEKAEEARQKALEKQEEIQEEIKRKQEERQAKEEEYNRSKITPIEQEEYNNEVDYIKQYKDEIQYKEKLLKLSQDEIELKIKEYEQQGFDFTQTKEYYDMKLQYIKDEIALEKLREETRVKLIKQEQEISSKQSNYEVDLEYNQARQNAFNQYKIDDTASLDIQIQQANKLSEALQQIERDKQDKLYQIQLEGIEKQLALLETKKEKGLITENEYKDEMISLNAEKLSVLQEISNKEIDIEKQKGEELKEVQELIKQQQQELVSAIGGLLGGIADNLSDDTEAYKHLKAAEAIINTLSASVATFSGITSSTGGWGIALAIAQASAVIASGMATVKQIYSVNTKGKNSTNYTMTNSASNALNKNYTNTRLTDGTGAEINLGGEISKSLSSVKVYVSASDITSTQNQMKRVEVSNSF
jgi:myosin heavy subunit